MLKQLSNVITGVLCALLIASITAAASSYVKVEKTQVELSNQKESLLEIKQDVKEIKGLMIRHMLRR